MGGMLSTEETSPMGGALAFLTRRKRPAENVPVVSRPVKIQRTVEVQEEDSDVEIIEKDEQLEDVDYSDFSEIGEHEEQEEDDDEDEYEEEEEEELNVYKSSEDDEPKPVGDEQVDPDTIDIHSGTRNSAIPVNGSEGKTNGEELINEAENVKKATNNVVVAEKTPETESALKVDKNNRSKIIDEQIDVNSESSNGQMQKSENGVNGGAATTAHSHDLNLNKNKTVVANELAAPTPPVDSSSTLPAPTIVA